MFRSVVRFSLIFLILAGMRLSAQDFKLDGREVQIHGFASQGFIYTDHNNWLTMHTSQGSGAFTDFGANISMQVTDKLRIGAQVYDRNLGNLGEWHPSVDWALVDYRFKPWFGIRAGKVKTTLGLYNDTQDLDFLRVFALLPQSVYPTDLRDATIAHLGGDMYGKISIRHRLGDFSYTAYVGHSTDSIYSGYTYLAAQYGVSYKDSTALKYGADLRWNTPIRGLLVGASRTNEDTHATAISTNPLNPAAGPVPSPVQSKADWTNQFYGEYAVGKLRIDSEYRRFVHDGLAFGGALETLTDVHGWYFSGTYRLTKRIAVGSYDSHYSITDVSEGPLAFVLPDVTDTSLPANHIDDKVITMRVDIKKFWNVKIEGHFMNGYGASTYPDGFYPQVNLEGFHTDTNALVIRTSMNF